MVLCCYLLGIGALGNEVVREVEVWVTDAGGTEANKINKIKFYQTNKIIF